MDEESKSFDVGDDGDAGWSSGDIDSDDEGDWGDCLLLPPEQMDLLRQASVEAYEHHLSEAEHFHHGDDWIPEEAPPVIPLRETPPEGEQYEVCEEWKDEIDVLDAIYGDDLTITVDELGCPTLKISVKPFCGTYELYSNVQADFLIQLTAEYPNECPEIICVHSEGINKGEALLLHSTLQQEFFRSDGEAAIHNMIVAVSEILTQKAMFVKDKSLKKKPVPKPDKKKKKKSKAVSFQNVDFLSTIRDGFVSKFLPSPGTLAAKLSGANCRWTISSVLSDFLRDRFKKKLQKIGGGPQVVFHGTSSNNSASISRHGLVVPGTSAGGRNVKIANGAAYGNGIYMSPYFSTAACYARGTIFLCVVAMGKTNNGHHDFHSAQNAGYNSNASGSIYVAFDAAQVLPCYQLSYEGNPHGVAGTASGPTQRINISQTVVTFLPPPNLNVKAKKKKKWAKKKNKFG